MEHSKLKLETPVCQIPGSSCSLSVPSEPHDLENWLASYRYESPTMNFDSFRNEFGTGESERGKDEGNSCGFREIGNKVGVFVHEKADGVVKCGRSSQDQCLCKISGSSESPSSLSEPTDIKNWFASYVYESPSLDTTDGFGDSLAKQSECEKDGFLVENSKRENEEELRNSSVKRSISREVVGEKEQSGGLSNCDSSWRLTKQARQSIPEAPGPLESPSLLSEPVHIKNWFSSYVYESPSLDTYDNDSVGKESKCEKDGFMVENRKSNIEENLGDFRKSSVGKEVVDEKKQSVGLAKCDSSWRDTKHDRQPVHEVPGHLDSSSHLSEPTDIQNWFSSYVYESPSLDTADGFGDVVCRDRIDEKDKVLVETSNKEKGERLEGFGKKESDNEEFDVEKVQSEEFAKHNTTFRHSKKPVDQTAGLDGLDENLSGQSDFCLEYKPNMLQNYRSSQPKHAETSSFNKGDSQCKVDQQTNHGTRHVQEKDGTCPQNLVNSRGCTSQESSEAKVHAEEFLLETNSELISVNEASVSKTTHGSKERKDDGTGISEDGFITTRKRKFTARNDENSPKGPPRSTRGTVPSVCVKDVVIERKTLADTTNFHHSPATMITGKWKCPQQRKPNLGPPLKQLGLEHWIRKS